jgi:hypothetical protein
VTVQGGEPDLRERHIGELISELAAETGTLVRQEMALARAELAERMDVVRGEFAAAVELARSETGQKLDQAKADVTRKGKQAGAGLGMFGAAGIATLLALATLTACLVLLLNRWLPTDVAALVLAVAWALVATAAALRGRDKVHEAGGLDPRAYVPSQTIATVADDLRKVADPRQLVPEQTIETVKEDVEWAKTPRRSAETSSRRANG